MAPGVEDASVAPGGWLRDRGRRGAGFPYPNKNDFKSYLKEYYYMKLWKW
jgi:hypothetical protein